MLVDAAWLAERLDDPGVVVVDMRWREDGSARAAFERGHIPGAVFLDWATDLVDPEHRLAFMLAPSGRFAEVLGACGIGDDTTVVAYADDFGSGPFRLWLGALRYGSSTLDGPPGAATISWCRPTTWPRPRTTRTSW